jgi:hypothetical protein
VNAHPTRGHTKVLNDSLTDQESRPWLAGEKQQQLFSRYPLFFRSVHYPKAYPSNLAFLGIQCGFGWYSIIETAAREIEQELHMMWCEQARSPEYLASMDYQLRAGTSLDVYVYPVIPFCSDIRVVAGQLQVSMVSGYLCDGQAWLRIRESITKAEVRTRAACERCGEPGVFREMYWEHVYCNDCVAPKPAVDPFETDSAT